MPGNNCSGCPLCRRCCMVAQAGSESITTILSGASATGAWNCSNCWKCVEICPEGVDVFAVMMGKRRQEPIPAQYRHALRNIREAGYIFPIDKVNTMREMWGLEPIEPVDPRKVRKLLGCLDIEGDDREET